MEMRAALSEDLPEDVLEDLKEAAREVEKEIERRSRRLVKKKYPTNRDIAETIKSLSNLAKADPASFPGMVREALENQGFYTALVTDERIWRIYEEMARRGEI
ncbi:MAG: hypothetical protein F7B20_02545 [Aeropyrum sp.]|nr:hypothetical protein [Aeropyrum sp.]